MNFEDADGRIRPVGPEHAFIPHVGWLRHEGGDRVIALLRQGYYEAAEQAFFWLYLRPGDIFLDGGAHVGLFSVLASNATDRATSLIAIEPNPRTAGYLESNLIRNKCSDFQVIPAALWNHSGTIALVRSATGSSAFDHVSFSRDSSNESPAAAITIDDILLSRPTQRVSLLKLDVEGSELEAMEGATRSISTGLLPVVMIEFTEENLARRGLSSEELHKRVVDLDYKLFEFSTKELRLIPFQFEGPIWYRNLFACIDVEMVNERLATASERNQLIAADIIARADACARFKELEELARYEALAAESEGLREWLNRSESELEAERHLSDERRQWAVRSDALLEREKAIASQIRVIAEKSHELFLKEKQIAEGAKNWASRTEALLQSERAHAKEVEGWARRSDELLLAERQRVSEFQAWAKRSEEQLILEQKRSIGLRTWAERSDLLLEREKEVASQIRAIAEKSHELFLKERQIADGAKNWAYRTEELLQSERAHAREIETWARRSDEIVVAERRRMNEFEAWAKRSEEQLVIERQHSNGLRTWAERSERLLELERKKSKLLKDVAAGFGQLLDTNRRLSACLLNRLMEVAEKESSKDESEKA